MRKLNLSLTAAAFAGLSLLAACGGNPPPTTTTTTEETTQSAAPVPAPAAVTPGAPGTVTTETTHSQSTPAQ